MLSHQQMGHDAARAVGEHDATMDNFVISQDWKINEIPTV